MQHGVGHTPLRFDEPIRHPLELVLVHDDAAPHLQQPVHDVVTAQPRHASNGGAPAHSFQPLNREVLIENLTQPVDDLPAEPHAPTGTFRTLWLRLARPPTERLVVRRHHLAGAVPGHHAGVVEQGDGGEADGGLRVTADTAVSVRRKLTAFMGTIVVIPEGEGLCQEVVDQWFCWLSASVRAAPGEGPGSRRSARSVARTNGLDAGPARRTLVGGCRKISGEIVGCGPSPSRDGADTLEQGRIGPAAGHPFAQLCRHGAVHAQ